jgi:hypothetical protein
MHFAASQTRAKAAHPAPPPPDGAQGDPFASELALRLT